MKKLLSLAALGLILVTAPGCWKKKEVVTEEVVYPAYEETTVIVTDEAFGEDLEEAPTRRVSGAMQNPAWAKDDLK